MVVIATCDRFLAAPSSHDAARRVADWFAQLNDKMGGDLKKIKVVGQYMVEIWKACGMEGIDSNQVPEQAPACRAMGLWLCRAPAARKLASECERALSWSDSADPCKHLISRAFPRHLNTCFDHAKGGGAHALSGMSALLQAVQAACSMHADTARGPLCAPEVLSALSDSAPASSTCGARHMPCATLIADDPLCGTSTRTPRGSHARPRSSQRAPCAPRPQVQFLWASEEINKSPDEYWTLVMDVARRSTLARVRRCSQIMGREDSDDLSAAQIFYPCMQCADIFYLKVRARGALTLTLLPLHAVRRRLQPQGPRACGLGGCRAYLGA